MMRRTIRRALLAVTLSLSLAACSGSDGDQLAQPPVETAEEPAVEEPAAGGV